MKKIILPLMVIAVSIASCSKSGIEIKTSEAEVQADKQLTETSDDKAAENANRTVGVYTLYTIGTGKHTCDQTQPQYVSLSQMNFVARFDNSAIYTTVNPANQNDINMLYGFSEGGNHKYNSARIGWNYSNGSLKLYGYAYSKGFVQSKLITAVAIGVENTCKIKLSGNMYTFTVNGVSVTLPRGPVSYSTSGYLLYPYFGGTETAPHAIYIGIKDI